MKVTQGDQASIRAAMWTARALFATRRQLRRSGLEGLVLPRVPNVPADAARGVHAVLRRRPHTCLERALVLQRWYVAHGDPRDVIVGVRNADRDFRAHAWLEDDSPSGAGFSELLRVAP